MKSPKQTGLLVAALTLGITNLLLPALPTMAGTLMGAVVTTDGKPVAGALVTLWNAQRNRSRSRNHDCS